MFAKPRPPRILKPLIPLDSNGNPIQAQVQPRSPSTNKSSTSTPTKKMERVKFNVVDSMPSKLKTTSFRTSLKVAPPSFTLPAEEVTVTESTLSPSPRSRTQRLPFPKLETESIHDDGAELVMALQILQELRRVQWEDKPISVGNKKRDSSAELKFTFTTEMFYANGTESLIQVTRLLFDVLDQDQFMDRFRDCWPIHEKKQESVYRRIAFDWVQEICMEYPDFIHVEPTLSMFVTPSGDKYIRFLLGFVQCIMYIVGNRMQDADGEETAGIPLERELLEKPQFTENSELTRKQIYNLQTENEELMQHIKDTHKRTVQHITYQKQRERDIERQLREEEHQRDEQIRELRHYIDQYPNWFPENAEHILNSVRPKLVLGAGNNYIDPDSKVFSLPEVEDPLATVLNQVWVERFMGLEEKYNNVLTFCDNRKDFFRYIKSLQMNLDLILDGKDIPGLFEEDPTRESTLPDLGSYVRTCLARMEAFKQDFPPGGIPILLDANFHKNLASQIRKAELLGIEVKKLATSAKIDSDKLKDLKFRVKTMRMKMDHVNWNALIPLGKKNSGLDEVLTITPAKQYNLNQPTGRTPLMEKLLPSPVLSPFETPRMSSRNVQNRLEFSLRRKTLQTHHFSKLDAQTKSFGEGPSLRKISESVDSPVTSRQSSARALNPLEKFNMLPGKLTNQYTETVVESTTDDTENGIRKSIGTPNVFSPVELDSSPSVTVIAAKVAASRKSHERSVRLIKQSVRFSESPIRAPPVSETSVSFRKVNSLVETDGVENVSYALRSLEDEDTLGILDVSTLDFAYLSSEEEEED